MYIGLSRTLAKFGRFRLGIGMRLTKKNAPYLFIILMFVWMFQLMWYILLLCFWLMYAIFYGIYWCIKSFFNKFKKDDLPSAT